VIKLKGVEIQGCSSQSILLFTLASKTKT